MPDSLDIKTLMKIRMQDAVLIHPIFLSGNLWDTQVVQANAAACSLLQYSETELKQMTFGDLDTSGELEASYLKALGRDGIARTKRIFEAKNGTRLAVEIESCPVSQSSDLCLTVIHDTEGVQRLENDLREANLAKERACKIKQQFLANMSHELRTPLNGIMGMTQLLMGTELSPAQREYLSLSQDAARQLTRVLTDLLSLSNVEAGSLELAEVDFNVHDALQGLITTLSPQASSKSLTMILEIAPDVPVQIYGDVGKLKQILVNLLFNAIKFTKQGEVVLSVSKSDSGIDEEACTLDFTVEDTGIGIPEDMLETIFESFTLGEDYMTKQYGGAGLGLSISRQLATFMEGSLRVASTPGKGSRFTLTLPFQLRRKGVEFPPQHLQPHSSQQFRILLAEDEQVNSIMASRLLKKAGHSVTIVGNGQQAIETLSRNKFDLVLMDVQMPVVNGIQATEVIRSGAVENVPKDLPIIGLTAFTRPSEKERFMKAGMGRIVTKPYEPDELIQAVASVML